jgi:hypothetical protein
VRRLLVRGEGRRRVVEALPTGRRAWLAQP